MNSIQPVIRQHGKPWRLDLELQISWCNCYFRTQWRRPSFGIFELSDDVHRFIHEPSQRKNGSIDNAALRLKEEPSGLGYYVFRPIRVRLLRRTGAASSCNDHKSQNQRCVTTHGLTEAKSRDRWNRMSGQAHRQLAELSGFQEAKLLISL
jgi:hypothetical protein